MSTIVSISTAPGIGGIGIIRMSGEKSFEILDKIFKPKTSQKIEDIKGYTIKYGHIVENNEIIDEVLVSYFKAPRSYTTENMCEINSHGGNVVVKKILEICLKNGAELAEPGEFTKRAFLNGRIDLAQAESVIDVINAKSDKEAKSGIKQLEGYLSKEIKCIKQEILDVLVNIEVTIDYPEYDTPEVQEKEIDKKILQIAEKLGIKDILNKYPYQVSGGQKQRCASARAIVNSPKLILADEPTGSLDSKSARQLLEIMEDMNQKMKATILMVTHDPLSASYCSKILFLKDGKIFNRIEKGEKERKEFYNEILDVLALLGGDARDVR